MTKGRVALLTVAAIVFLTVGFVVGQMVQAAGTIPGTAGDPLVAQSYVEKTVGETVSSLRTKLDEMEAKVDSLQAKVNSLSGSAGKNNSSSKSSSNSTSNTSTSDTRSGTKKTSNSASTADKGKTVAVSGTSANVRSGPGTSYDKVTTLETGDLATIISEESSWYKISLPDGSEGWVANWLVEVK